MLAVLVDLAIRLCTLGYIDENVGDWESRRGLYPSLCGAMLCNGMAECVGRGRRRRVLEVHCRGTTKVFLFVIKTTIPRTVVAAQRGEIIT